MILRFAIVLVLAASGASAQYSLRAVASATGVADDVDETDVGGMVFAAVTGGSPGPDNPSVASGTAQGSPAYGQASASAGATTIGPNAAGSGSADLNATNDEIYFNALGPFVVRVSLDITSAVTATSPGDQARVDVSGTVRRRRSDGASLGVVSFNYTEINNAGEISVPVEITEPGEFTLEPGDYISSSLRVTASASANASIVMPDGSADANAGGRISITILSGAASIAGTLSGADYSAACNAADLAEPFGTLDLADINAFLAAFIAMDTAADLADPVGVLDLADINAFVGAFGSGCP